MPQLFFLFQELGITEPPKNVILHCSYLAVGSTIPHTALVKLCVFLDQLTGNIQKKHRWILVVVSTNFCFHFLIGEMMKHVFLFLTGLKSPTSCVFSYRLHDWLGQKVPSEVKKTAAWGSCSGGFYLGRSVFLLNEVNHEVNQE